MPDGRSFVPSSTPRQHGEGAGRRVVAVPAQYTSQDCNGCGERVPKSLSVRTYVCTSCGLVLDRGENAARNIQGAGQAFGES
jgi:putative transposase